EIAAEHGTDALSEFFLSLQVWGTPEQCHAKVAGIRERVGCDTFVACFRYAGMPVDEAERSMRLFAREVLPELKTLGVEAPARPAGTRSISSWARPAARPMRTCWPHSYSDRQFHAVRRIRSSRSRGGSSPVSSIVPKGSQRRTSAGWRTSVVKMLSGSVAPPGVRSIIVRTSSDQASRGSGARRGRAGRDVMGAVYHRSPGQGNASGGCRMLVHGRAAMDFSYAPADEEFRREIRAWLAANRPARAERIPHDEASLAEEFTFLRDWQRRLHAAGYVGLLWPREYGGRGVRPTAQAILNEELARARAPQLLNRVGVNNTGPTLIVHGNEAQKRRYLPNILSADEIWCQLFSEPGAGSDLAALRTRAEPAGDGFAVTGQKVWTMYAAFSDRAILLARTDPWLPK